VPEIIEQENLTVWLSRCTSDAAVFPSALDQERPGLIASQSYLRHGKPVQRAASAPQSVRPVAG